MNDPTTAFFAELNRLPLAQKEVVLPVVIALFASSAAIPLDPALTDEANRFAASLDIDNDTAPDVVRARIQQHFAAHGVTDALFRELTALLHSDPAARASAARALLATSTSNTPLSKTPPPPGAVGAGPLARFTMTVPPKK